MSIKELFEELEEQEQNDIKAIMEILGNDSMEEAFEIFESSNFTSYGVDTLEELAEMFVDEGLFGKIEEKLSNYIDYEAIGRDLGYDGYTETSYGVYFVE